MKFLSWCREFPDTMAIQVCVVTEIEKYTVDSTHKCISPFGRMGICYYLGKTYHSGTIALRNAIS